MPCSILSESVGKVVIRQVSSIISSNKFNFRPLEILITFPVMQLTYLDLFELCYTDLGAIHL